MDCARHPWRVALALALIVALVAGCAPTVERLEEQGDVGGLVEALLTRDQPEVRAQAAAALGDLGDPRTVDPLLHAAAHDVEAEVRRAAVDAVADVGDEAALVPLLEMLDEGVVAVREAVEGAVPRLVDGLDEGRALAVLGDALGHEEVTVRAGAAEALGELGAPEAIVALLALGDDSAVEARRAAEAAVAAIVDGAGRDLRPGARAAATGLLIEALAHQDPTVREGAADALAGLGDRAAVEPLLAAQLDEAAAEAAGPALVALLDALPDVEAVTALMEAVEEGEDAVAEAAGAALADLLGRYDGARAAEAVLAVGADDAWLATALGVTEEELPAETRRLSIQLEPYFDIVDALSGVADGVGVDEARPYEDNDAFHPAVVLGAEWPDAREATWAPTALRFAELVVVVEDVVWDSIEVCLYHGPDITRYQGERTVRLHAAHDGEVIAERTFQGEPPRECQATEPYHLTELHGEEPDLDEIGDWLDGQLAPP